MTPDTIETASGPGRAGGSGLKLTSSAPTGGPDALRRRIAETFVSNAPASLETVGDAIASRNAATLKRAAHNLKGTLGLFDAPEAVAAAGLIEQHAENRRFDAARRDYANLVELAHRVIDDLKQTL